MDLSPRGPVALPGPQGIPVFLIMSEETDIRPGQGQNSLLLCFAVVVQLPPLHRSLWAWESQPRCPHPNHVVPFPVPSSFLLGPLGPLPSLIGFCGAEFTGTLHSPVRLGLAAALPPPFLANWGASLLRGGPPSQPPPAHAAVCLLPQTMLEACCP